MPAYVVQRRDAYVVQRRSRMLHSMSASACCLTTSAKSPTCKRKDSELSSFECTVSQLQLNHAQPSLCTA